MDYCVLIFYFLIGLLFVLTASNKTDGALWPVLGAVLFVLFWVLYNTLILEEINKPQRGWLNTDLWLEAFITSFVGALMGQRKNCKPKNNYLRFCVPLLLLIVYVVLL